MHIAFEWKIADEYVGGEKKKKGRTFCKRRSRMEKGGLFLF
jgi:hypothetical protein